LYYHSYFGNFLITPSIADLVIYISLCKDLNHWGGISFDLKNFVYLKLILVKIEWQISRVSSVEKEAANNIYKKSLFYQNPDIKT